ncbi:MAG TPA: bifunctional diaminohydroxyphosphoribosylaminopyrimidine deaminase/5-amino-6-(5-phosphoribosylamino)uracil reductase RibD [Methylibium sp.]|uniref:bifunctional diaminohydroxyphosphoribosylaminopyrimidine deaminase/5-amino-6-(5-phosphoribosylamino)uracil reductase RibD n=1 Tax=Methylibium sp. TaxID=2067992 RepID=UPI002DB8675C|nr:bifunctional diaminohydroxyphosphoribosylaminopyrimidine deaminase/5-amino-6-(5-phosphoribosylamino)uracil reductase RibD [Methylibium sp.]HEU4457537.1 bifunctional diaminohydroxyphosphoribosylaminopyrimidine deaminase/5-amino-6-(5-phosphoribosylamino)uracil reductase RibD [Methylibium sp.]
MPTDARSRELWAQALVEAEQAVGVSDPNPRVGCLITDAEGRVLGRGSTQAAGGPHAEVMALRAVAETGATARGATAWVTLEPCSHHGRTPPCCEALTKAGIARVVAALRDPNPLVGGQGLAKLAAAGLEVHLLDADDPVAIAARELNIGFVSRMERGRPWVRMKIAASLDGRTALDDGASQWITGEAARADGHAWRRRASAVLTGIGTVHDDDPRLDVRLVPTQRQPLRVVVDSRLEIAPAARILQPPGEVLLVHAGEADASFAGAQTLALPGRAGKVDLVALLDELAQRGVNELHVEAGHKLNGSFVREGLVDEYLIYLAPKLIGAGREMARFGPLARLADAVALDFHAVDRIAADLRVLARPRSASSR